MPLRLIAFALFTVTLSGVLAGCASGDHAANDGMGGDRAMAGAAIQGGAGAAGFIGPDGPVMVAPPQIGHALETAPANQPQSWTDADSGATTQFTAIRLFQKDDNSYCREYSESVTVSGKTSSVHGTACRDSDGTWRAAAG
jgi:surface antigen